MAQGEATRPVETVDGQPLDSSLASGDKSLAVTNKSLETLVKELVANQQELLTVLKGSYILNVFPANVPDGNTQALAVREAIRLLVPLAPAAASVGTSSAVAVVANSLRKSLVLINTSSNTISFGLGYAAVLSSGITLAPNSSWTMTTADFTAGPISAIASGAGSNLAIQEFI